ncbi:unnamed protein product [Blepharisma stoltei]|uniref:Uncharacterized protein n=1 Tax=Blepharisma stoltei TaxID=1481888 RepID=A0AAU9JDL3_9CILI|nr:unnamed protein product [Blepharisma stoltei]
MDITGQQAYELSEFSKKILSQRLNLINFRARDPSPVMKIRDMHQPCRGEIKKIQGSIPSIKKWENDDFMNSTCIQVKLYKG